MSLKVGDRVQPHKAIGTIEKIRTSEQGYEVAEVLWETKARSAEPIDWLDPELDSSPIQRPASVASPDAPSRPRLQMGIPAQPLYETVCIDCATRWVRRKAVALGAETVCGRCAAKLAPAPTWTTLSDGLSVLLCNDCAARCHKCRPVDARLQWGDSDHAPSYYRNRTVRGKQAPPPESGKPKRECEGCRRRFSPTRKVSEIPLHEVRQEGSLSGDRLGTKKGLRV